MSKLIFEYYNRFGEKTASNIPLFCEIMAFVGMFPIVVQIIGSLV